MVFITDILISQDVFRKKFVCALDSCKGACCWEGDFGAPLEEYEVQWLRENINSLQPFLTVEGWELIQESGVCMYYPQMEKMGTPLRPDGSCAYLVFESSGKARCGIQMAFESRADGLQKPISCHLFPLRILEEPQINFVAINYEQWDICSAGCSRGESMGIPVFRFSKDALIRRFGLSFYSELERVYLEMTEDASPDDLI